MKKVNRKLLVGILALLVIFATACGGNTANGSNGGKVKQSFTVTSAAEISTMDPALATDTTSTLAMSQVYEGLYVLGEKDEFELGVAAKEPKISKDKKTYTFDLRKDAKWSNGDPVTADDFVYAWRKMVDPATASPNADVFSGVIKNAEAIFQKKKQVDELGVKAIDKHTLEVQLEVPIPYIKSILSYSVFFPKNQKFNEKQGKKYAKSSDNLVYNGPFQLANWNGTSKEWSYKKNPEYWDKKKVKLTDVNVTVVKSPGTGINLFNTNKVDVINKLDSEYAKRYLNDKNFKSVPQFVTFFLKLNPERNGKKTPLANEHMRKAVAQAFDKKQFTDQVLSDGSTPTDQLIPKGQSKGPDGKEDFTAAAAKANDYLTYNKAAAQKEWKLAQQELGKNVTLEFLTDDTDIAKTSSEYFQSQLETNLPGLKVKVKMVPFTSRVQLDNKHDYDVELGGWGTDYRDPLTVMRIFKSGSGIGGIAYNNKAYDKLIDATRTVDATNNSKRMEDFIKAQNMLINEDTMLAPIYNRSAAILSRTTIKDMYWHAFGPDYSLKYAFVK